MRLLLLPMATENPLSIAGAHGPLEMSKELWLAWNQSMQVSHDTAKYLATELTDLVIVEDSTGSPGTDQVSKCTQST